MNLANLEQFTKYSLLTLDEFTLDEVFLEPITRLKRGIAVVVSSCINTVFPPIQLALYL